MKARHKSSFRKDVMALTNFERLREIVKTTKPERLESFDAYVHKKRAALHQDDDLWMILEIIGFHTELAADIPERLVAVADRVAVQAAQVEEASALVQNEGAKILSLLKNLADELPQRVDTASDRESHRRTDSSRGDRSITDRANSYCRSDRQPEHSHRAGAKGP